MLLSVVVDCCDRSLACVCYVFALLCNWFLLLIRAVLVAVVWRVRSAFGCVVCVCLFVVFFVAVPVCVFVLFNVVWSVRPLVCVC